MMYLVYASLATISSILGGVLPLYTKVRNINSQYLIGFASGILISTALFEILPEALVEMGGSDFTVPLAAGFFTLYLIEKVAMIHACKETECELHHTGWVGMIGLSFESLLDGIAIAVGFIANPSLGLFIALAVIVHEFPVGFSTSVIMRSSGYSVNKSFLALVLTSALTIIGALIAPVFPPSFFGAILAFTAGSFMYIGASDLLPEAHRQRVNWWVVAAVFSGALIIPLIEYFTHL